MASSPQCKLTSSSSHKVLKPGANSSNSFLINNDGFTIERFIHGMNAGYNDINEWKYKELVRVFGGEKTCKTFTIKTKDELNDLLVDEEFKAADCLQFVELYMPREDAPRALIMTAEASAKNNAKK